VRRQFPEICLNYFRNFPNLTVCDLGRCAVGCAVGCAVCMLLIYIDILIKKYIKRTLHTCFGVSLESCKKYGCGIRDIPFMYFF